MRRLAPSGQGPLPATGSRPKRLREAVSRAADYLRQQQRSGDHWAGVLSSSALATAMSSVALHVADQRRHTGRIRRGRQWLFDTQRSDGGWGDAVVDPPNINATALALAALVLTGGQAAAEEQGALLRARLRLESFGGFGAVGDPARCTLSGPCRSVAALAGLMDPRGIKRLRPEVILLPRRLRRTISTTFPAYLSLATLHSALAPHPLNALPTYHLAARRAVAWLAKAEGADGSFEESAFLTSVIITGLLSAGHGPAGLPWLEPAIQFVLDSQRPDGSWPIDRDLETFDTDLTVLALHEAAEAVPAAERARDWLLARQFAEPCFATSAPPGGWAWAMPAGWPDSDDTAYTLLALRALGVPAAAAPIQRAADWLEGMQSGDGSWPTFVRGSSMPFDHDCPYVTGHVLSALQAAGRLQARPPLLSRALGYLGRAQRADGSFPSIWFREATAGTASVLEALADCGLADSALGAGARAALLREQNEDGGWAGTRGQDSTAEETAWAVLALLRSPADGPAEGAVSRGITWLLARQRADGTWVPSPIGLYYSAMWYSDTFYAIALPLRALARARRRYSRG